MTLDLSRESFGRALDARDARFDGVFFVGISTTGIYCRPICPARRTLPRNRRFFSNAAAAERAGFRPCLRCRPELAPGRARVDAVPRLVTAATERIAGGVLNGGSVDALAAELGVSGRHLRRAMQQEIGVTPIDLAQTQRLLLAKQLLTETDLTMSSVAYASGFQSVRRFNALVQARYRLTPDAIRRTARGRTHRPTATDSFQIALSYRPPLDWDALLGFLALRATPSVETVTDGSYWHSVHLDGYAGWVRAWHDPHARPNPAVQLEVSTALLPALMPLCARVRHLFDLDAEPAAIDAHLARTRIGALGRPRAGVRVPGAFDGFELALRAILGQQVTVKGATTLSHRLAQAFGAPLGSSPHAALTHLTPAAERLAGARIADIRAIGIPTARAETIAEVSRLVASGVLPLGAHADVRRVCAQLLAIRGIGRWTAEYIAMRALHWPDAFPAGDLALRKAAGALTEARLRQAAERWRPWRAYAAMQLWLGAGTSARATSPSGRRGAHTLREARA